MSHTDPSPVVVFDTNASLTNFPSFWKTWMRSFWRSQTYTWPSFAIFTQLTDRNCFDGGPFGSYGPCSASVGFSPYAPQLRLKVPVFASNTAMRWLPNPSATNSSPPSTASAAGRLKPVVLSLPSVLPALPICSTNLPSFENFSTCASAGGGGPAAPRPRPAWTGASPRPAGTSPLPAGTSPRAPPPAASAPRPAAAPRAPPRPAVASDGVGRPLPIHTLPCASMAIPDGLTGQS